MSIATPFARFASRVLPVWAVLAALGSGWQAPPPGTLGIMPMPFQVERGDGQLVVDGSFTVATTGYKEERLDRGVQRFLRNLHRRTGLPWTAPAAGGKATLVIHTDGPSKDVQEPGEDESYALAVSGSGARLSAANPLGILHGLETLLQMVEITPAGFACPAVTIYDTPRFAWRGLMVDVSRHFIPMEVLRRNLDGMAAVKMNVFHWHLSDDQGFRAESRRFPKLHGLGSDGQFYTQAEIREMVGYARDRGIRVVPEFDMPGHSISWFAGYPELSSEEGPYHPERRWGVFDPAMDPTRDQVYEFLDHLTGEMAALFPDRYFHIGGDEVNGKQWARSPRIQEFMKSHGLKSNQDLQAFFTRRVQKIVSKHGKVMVGWDEVLTPGMEQGIVIQSWRGADSLAATVRQGYAALLSHGYYLDLMWPAARHYGVDPISGAAAGLSSEEQKRVLGGEATMWEEFASEENFDSRVWPRLAAIAERLWSPAEVRDPASMYERLSRISWFLDTLGLTHNSSYLTMLQRLAGGGDVTALRVLADVVEPVKEYDREELAQPRPTNATPLNRLVDAARPESEAARRFSNQVSAFVAGQCKDADLADGIRAQLIAWREHAARLRPLIEKSLLLQEVEPISQNLAFAGAAGLEALDYAGRGQKPPDSWKSDRLAKLERAKPASAAQVLLMVVAPVQTLVESSASGGACRTETAAGRNAN